MAAAMMPMMMMSSMASSCSSCISSPTLLIWYFYARIAAFIGSYLNPFKAAGKIGGAVKGAAKGVARVGKKAVRGIGRAGKKAGRGISRAGKKIGRGVSGLFKRRRCFSPETLVKLRSGKTVMMKNLKLGDVLNNGSIVDAVMKIKNENDPYYKLPGNILVTGTHYVKYGGKYIRVKDVPDAKPTGKVDPVVYCLVTSDHKIPVGDYTFWDWEDNLIPTRQNLDNVFKKIRSERRRNTVTV
jgi:hypothetical protein